MLRTLIEKELKAILLSPKFIAVFIVCSILIVLSFYLGIKEYRVSIAHYEAVNTQISQEMQNIKDWGELNTNIMRHPDPMQIFISGVSNDIGRQSPVPAGRIKLYNSKYSENMIFAFFRPMDLMFIVQIVLSLFAILFTYDSICGERETGTLKLNFAYQLPRSNYIIAKLIGSWLGLVIPLLIPLSLGILLILLNNIPMTITHWFKLCLLIGISFLYFSFFISLGVMISSLAKLSSSSFLYLLVIWVSFVLIIPRAGVMVAGQFIPVPTAAEISSKLTQKNRELTKKFTDWMNTRQKEIMAEFNPEAYEQFIKNLEEKGAKLKQDRVKYSAIIEEDWRNRKAEQEKYGFSLSRFSPASAFQLAAMDLAGTGINLKKSYEDQILNYGGMLAKFRAKKVQEVGNRTDNSIMNNKTQPLDFSEMPKFKYVNADLHQILHSTIIDIGIISFYVLITMAGTFIAFIRYDVR